MAYWPHPMAKTPEIGVGHEFNNLGTGLHYILSMHAFSYISELYKIIRVEKNFFKIKYICTTWPYLSHLGPKPKIHSLLISQFSQRNSFH